MFPSVTKIVPATERKCKLKTTSGRLFKIGDIYYARWRHNKVEHQRATGETTEKKAKEKLKEWLAPFKLKNEAETLHTLAQRADTSHAAANALLKIELRFSDAWRKFLESETRRRPREATLRQYEIQWERFVEWLKGAYPEVVNVEAVNPGIAAAFIRHLSDTRTANTANKYRGLLAMVWDRLKEDGHITAENPWEKIARREQHDEGRRELTVDELRRVCQAAQGDLRILIAIGIYTGLRLADAATLRWGEVDLVRGIIRRVPSKSRKGRLLTIPIHAALRAVLTEIEPEKRREYVVPEIARDYETRRTNITDRIQKLIESCEIKTLRDRKGPGARKIVEVGYHSLRHAFVSMCAEGHVPLSVVQGLIGHTTTGMTEKYFHLSAGAANAAIAALPSVTGEIIQPLALPPPQADIREQVRATLDKLNGKNWREIKRKALVILNA